MLRLWEFFIQVYVIYLLVMLWFRYINIDGGKCFQFLLIYVLRVFLLVRKPTKKYIFLIMFENYFKIHNNSFNYDTIFR